jgi:hypothetical protein
LTWRKLWVDLWKIRLVVGKKRLALGVSRAMLFLGAETAWKWVPPDERDQ